MVEEGYAVHGSTTSPSKIPELEKAGILPFSISLAPLSVKGKIGQFLSDVDVLVINVPPKLRGGQGESYVDKMLALQQELAVSNIRHVVFVSSTSVYGEVPGSVTEETTPVPSTLSGKQLLISESTFKDTPGINTTILRFGGLIGADRHPVYRLSGKENLANGGHPINLIHLDDCIGIIKSIVKNGWWNETFNAVYPSHPTKEAYYTSEALKRKLPPPTYLPSKGELGKKIESRKLIHVKKYRFLASIHA